MSSDDIVLKKYPEWYRLEKETEKTINKLSNIEELKFYLKNSDDYIRRLAILRINELKLKDSINVLEEILDDQSECLMNKELAAWSIKSICLKWDIELYNSNRLLYKFTGNENYGDIFNISIDDSSSSFKFSFSTSPLSSKLEYENDNNHRNQDISFDTYFSFKEWLEAWYSEFIMTGKQKLISFPLIVFNMFKSNYKKWFDKFILNGKHQLIKVSVILWNIIKNFFTFTSTNMFIKLPKMMYRFLVNIFTNYKYKRNIRKNRIAYNDGYDTKSTQFISIIKDAIYGIFYKLFFPVRLIMSHKSYTLASLIAIYYLLTFTDTGKAITYNHFGLSLIELQNKFFEVDLMKSHDEIYIASKKLLIYAWIQTKDIAEWMYIKWINEIGGI